MLNIGTNLHKMSTQLVNKSHLQNFNWRNTQLKIELLFDQQRCFVAVTGISQTIDEIAQGKKSFCLLFNCDSPLIPSSPSLYDYIAFFEWERIINHNDVRALVLSYLERQYFFLVQRYERRGKKVKTFKRTKWWRMITPDMTLEKEKVENTYITPPPSYRSEGLEKFLTMLDERAEKSQSKMAQPRFPQQLGSPVTKVAPPHVKKWMKREEGNMSSHIANIHVNNSDEELFYKKVKKGV